MRKSKVLLMCLCVCSFLVSTGCQRIENEFVPNSSESADPVSVEQSELLSEEDAKDIAISHSKIENTDEVVFQTPVIEQENDAVCYEIKFTYGHDHYEYEIDANSGETLSFGYESGIIPEITDSTSITLEEAKAIALSWATVGELECVFTREEFLDEENPPVFAIEFLFKEKEYELEIFPNGVVAECSMEQQTDMRLSEPGRTEK